MIRILSILLCAIATTAAAVLPVLTCPTDPPAVRRLQLQERWRIDPENADAPLLSYFDQAQIAARDGRLYLLDPQLCHVLVYSDDGRHLDTILREGDGPGEIRNPGVLFFCRDGRLAVQHGYPSKLEFVDTDGTPRGRWTLRANAWANRIQETPQGWFCVYTEARPDEETGEYRSEFHAALHDDDGQRIRDFHTTVQPMFDGPEDEADTYEPWYTASALSGGGMVTATARDVYRLQWFDPSGAPVRTVTRPYPAHHRTEAEIADKKYSSYSIVDGKLKFNMGDVCTTDPMIRTLEPLPDGGVRVRTALFAKEMSPGMVCRYEVHGPDGELRERVEIYDPTGNYDVAYDALAMLDDGRAMVLRNLSSAFRTARQLNLHPDVAAKLPPLPDDREDIAFTPILCDLVPKDAP